MRRALRNAFALLLGCGICLSSPAHGQPFTWEAWGPWGGTIRELAMDPENPETLYALLELGVFKSTDAGQTWVNSSFGIDLLRRGRPLFCLTISPHDSQILYVGGYGFTSGPGGFIYRSDDGGASWTRLGYEQELGHVNRILVDWEDPELLYAACSGGFFRSPDGGRTWEEVLSTFIYDADWDPFDAGAIFATTNAGIKKSLNRAVTWTDVNSAFNDEIVYEIVFDPNIPGTLFWRSENGYYVSHDGGKLASLAADQLPFPLLVDHRNPDRLYAGHSGGLNVSRDGGNTWQQINQGLGGISVWRVALDGMHSGRVYISVDGGNVRSDDQGETWTRVEEIDKLIHAIRDPADPNVAYRSYNGTDRTRVLKTEDGGVTWNPTGLDLDTEVSVSDIDVFLQRPNVLYAAAGSLYRSEDSGDSWVRMNSGDMWPVAEVAADPRRRGTVYARVGWKENPGLFKTEDDGNSWRKLDEKLFGDQEPPLINRIGMDRSGVLFVFAGGKIYTSDGGEDWREWDINLPPTEIWDIAIDPSGSGVIYLATRVGLYVSHPRSATLVEDHHSIPVSFHLSQNFPNPFNARTTISYQLPQTGEVELAVFDIAGQRVRCLVDEVRTGGSHRVVWDGTDDRGESVGSGVYLYRLTVGGLAQTRRLVLLK